VTDDNLLPDYQQPWVPVGTWNGGNIQERNLCVPTAFAMVLGYMAQRNFISELPVGVAYPDRSAIQIYNSPGWNDYMYDGPAQQGTWPPSKQWADAQTITPEMPSLNWWMNTNGVGATNVAGYTNSGTQLDSALEAMTVFFTYVVPPPPTWWTYHKGTSTPHQHGTLPTYFHGVDVFDQTATYASLESAVLAGRVVVLFLDSYRTAYHATPALDHEARHLLSSYSTSTSTEDNYFLSPENLAVARGHAVVLMGTATYDTCLWVIVRDGDHTTDKNVMLPWDTPCSSTSGHRSLWEALIASFHVNV
jgi:hypothetical protein